MNSASPAPDAATAAKHELAREVLRTSGKLRLQVNGWSMLPTILPGDTLLVERAEAAAVSEGDIVLYGRERRFFAHRVISAAASHEGDQEIVTRGDAMPRPDAPVSHRELLGKVAGLVRHGKTIAPRPNLRIMDRAVAALARRSPIAARALVRVHNLRQAFAS
ncbi:MAG TPA: S24/S26 family peptidase [Candidatus Solibacter sp.]|nr:S24/S26 family peptidase [Candidatus Solibacter sp.]